MRTRMNLAFGYENRGKTDLLEYLVTTSLVIFSGEECPRARPKSASFIWPSHPNSKFAGFKSSKYNV